MVFNLGLIIRGTGWRNKRNAYSKHSRVPNIINIPVQYLIFHTNIYRAWANIEGEKLFAQYI